jgi:chorismate synthase
MSGMFRFLTAGESHGEALVAVIDDLATKEAVEAVVERSDVCAVPAAGIVGEAMMAIVLAGAFLEKFGGDSLEEIRRNHDTYLATLKTW